MMELRSKIKTSVTPATKLQSVQNSNGARAEKLIPKPINALKSSIGTIPQRPNQSNQNEKKIADVSEIVIKAMNEVLSLRNAFMNLQKSVDQSLDLMSAKINAKSDNFVDIMDSLQNEIDSIKRKLQIKDAVVRNTGAVAMDTRFAHILHGNALTCFEHEYGAQIERLQSKLNEIEKSNEQTAETVNDLTASISTFMSTDSTTMQSNDEAIEKIDDIENAIKCIEHEIDRMKTSSFDDGEKLMKVNRQIHVLSAKYVDFNTKMNRCLLDFNRMNMSHKINNNEIIDDDAKPYMEMHERGVEEKASSDKPVTNNKLSSGRFVRPYDKYDYKRSVCVEIKCTETIDLNKFKREFENEFERSIGKNIVKQITIRKYRMQEGLVKHIGCVVEFQVPLNLEYINNHKFPANWDFLPMYEQRRNGRMTSRAMNCAQ